MTLAEAKLTPHLPDAQKKRPALEELSETQLHIEVEQSLIDCCRFCLARSEGTVLYDQDDAMWFRSGVRFPLYNGIYGLRPKGDVAARVAEFVAPFRAEKVPMVVCVGPMSGGYHVGRAHKKLGLWHVGGMPGLAMSLPELSADWTAIEGFEIEEVRDEESLRAWVEIQNLSFEFPDWVSEATLRMTRSVVLDEKSPVVRLFLGRWQGQPVATSMLVLGAKVAGIYNVACLPEARRKGFGAAMTAAPLLLAHKQGYQIGVLHATPMSEALYQKMGFEIVCTLNNYVSAPISSMLSLAAVGVGKKISNAWRGWRRRL